jgi:hypothetical protein
MLDVATINFRVANTESRCCRHVLLGVANIIFQCCNVVFRCRRHLMLGVMSRRREKRLLMLDVASNTGRNMTAI